MLHSSEIIEESDTRQTDVHNIRVTTKLIIKQMIPILVG